MPRLETRHHGVGFVSQGSEENIPGRRNDAKTAENSMPSSRILEMVVGSRLSPKIIAMMTESARSVRMNRYASPCKGSDVMDTTTDGIDSTRVAMRKPSMRLSDFAVGAFGTNQPTLACLSDPHTRARGDAVTNTRGSISDAASRVENVFNSWNDPAVAFPDVGETDGEPTIKEADKGTVMAVLHAKAMLPVKDE